MRKSYVMTPGPVPISNEVLIEHGRPLMHHRSPEFSKIFTEVTEKLKKFMQTENDVLVYIFRAGQWKLQFIDNSTGDKVLVVNVGNFGDV